MCSSAWLTGCAVVCPLCPNWHTYLQKVTVEAGFRIGDDGGGFGGGGRGGGRRGGRGGGRSFGDEGQLSFFVIMTLAWCAYMHLFAAYVQSHGSSFIGIQR